MTSHYQIYRTSGQVEFVEVRADFVLSRQNMQDILGGLVDTRTQPVTGRDGVVMPLTFVYRLNEPGNATTDNAHNARASKLMVAYLVGDVIVCPP